MNRKFLPFYISRAVISVVFAAIISGFGWQTIPLALFFFGGTLLYLHSGWFQVDLTNPFFPLRRDQRAELIQRKALLVAIVVGFLAYLLKAQLPLLTGMPPWTVNPEIPLAIIAYFLTQFALLSRV